jgi:hypothetical protein
MADEVEKKVLKFSNQMKSTERQAAILLNVSGHSGMSMVVSNLT